MLANAAPATLPEAVIAIDTVAQHTGLDRKAIEVKQTASVEWNESNRPCTASIVLPEGKARGYRMQVHAAGAVYVVHVVGQQGFVCNRGFKLSSVLQETATVAEDSKAQPADPASAALVAAARDDLARRLAMAPDEITLVEFKAVVWPDTSYGCPRPGMVYMQVQRDGVLIRLEAKGRRYAYHGGAGRAPFLCDRP